MRRIVLWSLSTLTVLVLLFGYHTSTAGKPEAAPIAVAAPVAGTAPPEAGEQTAPDADARTDTDTDAAPDPGAGASSEGRVVTGEAVATRWGPVQVAITVEDGAITDVAVPQYPANNPRDVEINSSALPVLVQETLEAQGAGIDMVSGATITSEGYVTSLQSALDQAGL